MCGIAGYVDFSSKVNPSVLSEMIDQIVYRGPDSSGKYITKNSKVGLGVRRLSIIDLKTGDQPIKNENGTIVVVYNGEIYNHRQLKEDLLKKGHKFRTKTDTEVLVHLYEEYKEEMPKRLNGMFAFAIWDETAKKLFIARDRTGIKPLYYNVKGKRLVFGSEVKTILKYPDYSKKIDDGILSLYFYFGYIPGEASIFSGVLKLLPGHSLTFSTSGIKIRKYFELSSEERLDGRSLSNLLEKAVNMQLMADVPVGVFLSGGLDSSLIAYYVSKVKKLKSFSIGFDEEGFDESKYAHYVASKLGTEHYSEKFVSQDVTEVFDEITSKLDEPLGDSSLFATFKVSKLARRYVKVVLSGDGGDELFGGYPTYQAHNIAGYLDYMPHFFHEVMKGFINVLPETVFNLFPASFKDYPKKRLAKIVLDGLKKKNPERHFYWLRTFFFGERLFTKKPSFDFTKKIIPNLDGIPGEARRGQITDFYTYLPDDLLIKVDRASMYNSLEARVPFLDNDVIDFAFSSKKLHANLLQTKIQLRAILRDKLPDVAERPKKGFGIPLERWLRGELKEFGHSMLAEKKIYDFIGKREIDKIWNSHQNSKENNSGILWTLIMFSGWLKNWL